MYIFTLTALTVLANGCSFTQPQTQVCIGTTELPANLREKLTPVIDNDLLAKAIGLPARGKLCQGQVYKTIEPVVIYRVWNSTNPNSQFGNWWAHCMPSGLVADYRENYQICYQWSPLDVMSRCTLKVGVKVVIGNGQSTICSEHLRYPVSASQQVYIEGAVEKTTECKILHDIFSWQ